MGFVFPEIAVLTGSLTGERRSYALLAASSSAAGVAPVSRSGVYGLEFGVWGCFRLHTERLTPNSPPQTG
jgi:hypothetical protein